MAKLDFETLLKTAAVGIGLALIAIYIANNYPAIAELVRPRQTT